MNTLSVSLNKFRRTPAFTGFVLFVIALLMNILMQGINSGKPLAFFNPNSYSSLLMTNAPFILTAMAQSLLLIVGLLDISIGIQLALVNVVCIMVPQELGVPIWVGWLCAMGASLLISAMVGACSAVLRLPAMLVGYAFIFIVKGINVAIMSKPQGKVPREIYLPYQNPVAGVLPIALIVLLAVFGLWLLIKRRPLGRHLYAVGGNPRNAYAAGISPVKVQMQANLLKGFIVGIGGICLTLMNASGNPLQAEDYGLRSLIACILGGLGFGGWGSMACGVFGASFFVLIQNTVYHFFSYLTKVISGFAASTYWQNLVSDIILLLGLLVTIITAKEQRKTLKEGLLKQFKGGAARDKQ
ncbi:MAG TPA: ABC transporter permease [Clostridia bacterium]|nr:ABC transporter permease [Clostridia bacterium]